MRQNGNSNAENLAAREIELWCGKLHLFFVCTQFLLLQDLVYYKEGCNSIYSCFTKKTLSIPKSRTIIFNFPVYFTSFRISNCHSVAHLSVDALMLTSFFPSFFFMRKLYSFGMLLMTTKKKSKMNRFSPKFYRFLKCHEDYLRFLSSKNKQQKTVWNIKL